VETHATDAHGIVAKTTYLIVAEVVSKVISLAFYIVLAREVGDAGFGIFTFALAFVSLVTTLSIFGQDAVVTREVARRRELIHDLFANTVALKLVLALVALALALVIATVAGMDGETRLVVLLLGLAVTAESLMATCFAAFQSFDRLGFIPIVLVSQRTATTLVGIPVVLLAEDVALASGVYLGAAIFALVLAIALLFRSVVRPRLRVDARAWWPFMRTALPIGLSNVFSTTLFRVDALILALFASEAVVGDYGAAYRLFEATLFVTWSVTTAAYPVFARLPGTGYSLRFIHERALKLGVAPTLPIAVGALVLGPAVVTLVYGGEFEEGGLALTLLAPAIALYPIGYVTAAMLVARDRQRVVATILGVVALENVVANVIFIPLFSLNAAALNTSISELLLAISLAWFARRLTGGLDALRIAAGPAIAGGLAAVTMLLLRNQLGLAVPAGAAVYLVVLVAWERKRFPEDARAVTDFILRRA
jgi:O-antigen/teichoic acid export membrane protein